jgi:hypothetical protein
LKKILNKIFGAQIEISFKNVLFHLSFKKKNVEEMPCSSKSVTKRESKTSSEDKDG